MIPVPRKLWGADLGREPGLAGAALDHLERTHPRHPPFLEHVAAPGLAAPEERSSPVLAGPRDLEVGVDVALRHVVGGDDVVPSAFLVEPEERPSPLGVVVGDPERDRRAHPREAVDEDAEERAVAEARQGRDVDAVEERPGLLGGEDRGLAGLDDVLWSLGPSSRG